MGSTVILDLMGGVAPLLWGLHMVHSGIVRAFGADLRRLLGMALKNRFRAFLAGAFVTALLQSSTATGLMAASFVTSGTLDLAPALAVMLGANVGTTLNRVMPVRSRVPCQSAKKNSLLLWMGPPRVKPY